MEETLEVNINEDIEYMDLSNLTQDTSKPRYPLKTTGYIHHTNHSTRSSFLHTQLQIKTTLKRRNRTRKP